jgi:hypothetical protein
LPPLSSAIVGLGKAVAAGGSATADGSGAANNDNPKAKSLISLPDFDNMAIAKGDPEHASKIQEAVKAHVDE